MEQAFLMVTGARGVWGAVDICRHLDDERLKIEKAYPGPCPRRVTCM